MTYKECKYVKTIRYMFRMIDPKGHTEAITEIVQENLPGVPGNRFIIRYDSIHYKLGL